MSKSLDFSAPESTNVGSSAIAGTTEGAASHQWAQGGGGGLKESKEWSLDRTLSETFPCSDPLSSIPNPSSHHFESGAVCDGNSVSGLPEYVDSELWRRAVGQLGSAVNPKTILFTAYI
jgi:hypothetical protein